MLYETKIKCKLTVCNFVSKSDKMFVSCYATNVSRPEFSGDGLLVGLIVFLKVGGFRGYFRGIFGSF